MAACDEVVRRFGKSETPVLQENVAKALVNKSHAFNASQRPDDAVAACDEVVRRFGTSEAPALQKTFAIALIHKGLALDALQRPDDAVAAYNEVVRRFGTSRAPGLVEVVAVALFSRGYLEIERRQFKTAIQTVDQLLDRCGAESPHRWLGHLIRAMAILAEGDRSGCEQDVGAILAILPELDPLPGAVVKFLLDFSVQLGPERMRELIAGSRSATLLQPLLVALEQELGIESQVAREVEEVARDVRKALARLRR